MKLATVRHFQLDVPMWSVVDCYLLLAAVAVTIFLRLEEIERLEVPFSG
jgi:hypothetical protein